MQVRGIPLLAALHAATATGAGKPPDQFDLVHRKLCVVAPV